MVCHETDYKTVKPTYSKRDQEIQKCYQYVRTYREEDKINISKLKELKINAQKKFPEQWLLVEEINELVK
jgi:hypothetical protein